MAQSQPRLFVESVYDALGAIVSHLGGPKELGQKLWPAKPADDAGKLLKDCLNPNRNEKLDPEQVVMLFRLAREADFHVAKHWLDDECGYLPTAPACPVEEQARLVDVIESAGKTMELALTRLESLRKGEKRVGR